ncbi:Hsp20/alpha crystallin family protein [Pseudomonadota bacterium]
MSLIRWTPWQELESMNRQLSQILDDQNSPMTRDAGQWLPPVDVRETEDALLVEVELPGIDKKEVKLDVKDGVLTISGERRYEKNIKEENVHRIERSYGSFSRSFSLPRNIDTEKIDANIKDGVLKVRLSKLETAKGRSITIS